MAENKFKKNLKYTNPEQIDLENKMFDLLDEFEKNQSFENREYLCYLAAAIYLTYKELYPRLSIYIPFRTKSDISYIKNIQKEFTNYMEDIDSKDDFDTSEIIKDISGLKIVLNDINHSLPSSEEFEELFSDPEISKLYQLSCENHKFADEVDSYLRSPIHNVKEFYEKKINLLDKIIELTPEEFTDERKPKNPFIQLYEDTLYQYTYFLENDNFPTIISEEELSDLILLSNDFRSRLDDKLHFAILRKTLPVVLNSPLVKNAMQANSKWDKEPLKQNAFQAIYYNIDTPFGPVELQAQSNKAYYAATKGSAYHSGLNGKQIDIKNFFELVDPNDEHELSYYLDILDNISADKLISPYAIPDFKTEEEKQLFLKTPTGKAFLESEKYREMMKHIKIKQKMQILPDHLPNEVYDSNHSINSDKLQELIANKKVIPFRVNTDEYLLSTALSLSPYMNVCGSGHTSYTTAGIHHKKIIGEFAEVLRKRDSNTCLRDLLIRKLEQIIDNPPQKCSDYMRACLQIVKEHDEVANKLPKDISHKNIYSFAEKLRNTDKNKKEDSELSRGA